MSLDHSRCGPDGEPLHCRRCNQHYLRLSGDGSNVEDNNDGTYLLSWRSKFSGTFKTRDHQTLRWLPRTFMTSALR